MHIKESVIFLVLFYQLKFSAATDPLLHLICDGLEKHGIDIFRFCYGQGGSAFGDSHPNFGSHSNIDSNLNFGLDINKNPLGNINPAVFQMYVKNCMATKDPSWDGWCRSFPKHLLELIPYYLQETGSNNNQLDPNLQSAFGSMQGLGPSNEEVIDDPSLILHLKNKLKPKTPFDVTGKPNFEEPSFGFGNGGLGDMPQWGDLGSKTGFGDTSSFGGSPSGLGDMPSFGVDSSDLGGIKGLGYTPSFGGGPQGLEGTQNLNGLQNIGKGPSGIGGLPNLGDSTNPGGGPSGLGGIPSFGDSPNFGGQSGLGNTLSFVGDNPSLGGLTGLGGENKQNLGGIPGSSKIPGFSEGKPGLGGISGLGDILGLLGSLGGKPGSEGTSGFGPGLGDTNEGDLGLQWNIKPGESSSWKSPFGEDLQNYWYNLLGIKLKDKGSPSKPSLWSLLFGGGGGGGKPLGNLFNFPFKFGPDSNSISTTPSSTGGDINNIGLSPPSAESSVSPSEGSNINLPQTNFTPGNNKNNPYDALFQFLSPHGSPSFSSGHGTPSGPIMDLLKLFNIGSGGNIKSGDIWKFIISKLMDILKSTKSGSSGGGSLGPILKKLFSGFTNNECKCNNDISSNFPSQNNHPLLSKGAQNIPK